MILRLAIGSLFARALTVGMTVLAIALSVALFLGVEKVRHGARESFENTISGVDLIVGARSSPVNLLLYSVFHIGDATNNITWESYETVASAPGVAWTVPISLGDSHRGHRVIGSTPVLFEHYEYGGGRHLEFASGAPFEDLFDAVIGAAVARDLGYRTGDEIVVAHGMGNGVPLAQRVQHEAGNPGAVLGTGIAGAFAPVAGCRFDRLVAVQDV